MNRPSQAVGTLSSDTRTPSCDHADIVIVGNGIAGLTAAIEARRLAPEKHVAIITEQSHPTISTPALKHFLIGKLTREQLLAYPAGSELAQHIHVIKGRVEEINTRGNFVALSNGQGFGYDSLLLATGSTPTGLPTHLPGRDFDGVLTLHRLGDYLDLRRRLREVKEAVIIGGGVHAVETVMSLLRCGIRVHWLIRSETCMPHMLDRSSSTMVLERSRRAGARVLTETEIVGIVGRVGVVAGVVTNHDQFLACQMVLACTGTIPQTSLAEYCDLPMRQHKQGILVDDQLRTNVRDIYAAGDVAALPDPQTGTYQRHAQWHAAVLQGRMAAATMTGHAEMPSPFGVSWHATNLGGLSLLTVGDPLSEIEGDEHLTESSKGYYRRISVRDDQLVGYLSLGPTQPDSLAMRRIIDEGRSIRDIKQALLKGNFDARQYFSQGQQRSHTVPTMIITGKLAVPSSLVLSSPRTDALYDTDPLLSTLLAEGKNDERESKDSEVSLQNGFGSLPTPIQEVRIHEQREPVKRSTPVISSFKSLMNKQFDPVKWVVPEVLPQGLIALVGKQRIGKSWLDLALGLAVASGDLVFGRIKVQQGHVLYLALEDNECRLQERLGKLLVPAAIPPDGFEYATAWPRMDADGLAAVEAWLVSHPQARLVIIDSWLKVKPRVERKAGATTSAADHEALMGLKQLAHTYKVCILVQFHTRKAAAANAFDGLDAVTNVAACADGVLSLKRALGEDHATLSGTGRAYVQDVHLALAFNGRGWEIIGNAAPCLLSQAHRAIIDVLNASGKPMKPKEIAQVLGKADGTIRKLLSEMKGSGVVRATEQGYLALLPQNEDLTKHENSSYNGNGSSRSNGGNSVEHITMQEFSTVTSTGPLTQELSLELW